MAGIRGEASLAGAYFFTGAFFLHAEQDGFIARQIREVARQWFRALRRALDEARGRGEIDSEVNAQQTAFELNGLLLGAQWSRQLDPLDLPKPTLRHHDEAKEPGHQENTRGCF